MVLWTRARGLVGLLVLLSVTGAGCNGCSRGGNESGGKALVKSTGTQDGAMGESAKEPIRETASSATDASISRAPASRVASPRAPLDQEGRFALERERMVEEMSSAFGDAPITDARVLEVMRRIPRHEFVPPDVRDQSYDNSPLPIAENQTISQPYIVALMTQLLELNGSEKVLEVGTGSGYQAAVLGDLAAEVYTVEIRPALLESAKKKLEELKARGVLRYKKLEAVVGDGSKGHLAAAPYDAIIVTAAPSKVPVELLNQLKPGGRLVIPVGDFLQYLQLIVKSPDGSYRERSVVPVRFVPLVDGEKGRKG